MVQDFKGYEAKIKEIEGEKRAMEAAHREKEWDFSDGAKAMNALMEDLKAQLDMVSETYHAEFFLLNFS